MSQTSSLNIYFVLPEEDKDCECSKDMVDAFNCVKQYKGKPQWVLPSFCSTHKSTTSDVFVFEEFQGPAFEILKTNPAKIVGAKCMLTCMTSGETIPPGTSPVFTEGMRDLIVCCTGFDAPAKARLQERIEYMGGIYDTALRTITTHVVAVNNITTKAIQAYVFDKPIMKAEWVDAVWNRSLQANVRGSDEEFKVFKAPIFNNLMFTSSGIPRRGKEKLQNTIIHHGGKFSGEMREDVTNILLLTIPSGEKFKAAKHWNVICLKPDWVYKCGEVGKIISMKDYYVSKSTKASTPVRGEVDLTSNFSMVSAIGNEDRNFTHVDESAGASSTLQSQNVSKRKPPPRSTILDAINDIMSKTKEAGHFLDGCNIFLSGFNQEQFEKLKKILNHGGATRFDELSGSVTHIIVSGTSQTNFPGSRGYILPLDWLKESVSLRKPATVEKYLSVEPHLAQLAPPSPLSKQSAMLLSRNESRPEPLDFDIPQEEFANEMPDDDIMKRYNLSQQVEPPPITVARNASSVSKISVSSRSASTEKCDVFHGLKFYLSQDLSEEELTHGEQIITQCGGTIVPRKFSGVPDYAVVPVVGAVLTKVTAKEIVNAFFIKDCFQENALLEVQYYHSPFTWKREATPLSGCVVCVSSYVGSERTFVETLANILGACIQAVLAKVPKRDLLKTSHLICREPCGQKYNGALRWGVPIVHHDWLLKCAELGVRVSEVPFLVGDSKLSTTAVTTNVSKIEPVAIIERDIPSVTNHPSTPVTTRKIPLETSYRRTPQQEVHEECVNVQQKITDNALNMELSAPTPVNKALERLKHFETPKGGSSPELDGNRTMTPTSPYGAFYGNENPSPSTRKRLHKWMNQGADFPIDPPLRKLELRRNSTPLSDLLSRQLRQLTRQPEECPPDDSPYCSPAKRPHLTPLESAIQETTTNELLSGLMKMKEIENSYSKTITKPSSPQQPSEEQRMLIVAESQPHTEIGWEDPSELAAVGSQNVPVPVEVTPKVFMLSGLNDSLDAAKRLLEDSGGRVSNLPHFDKNATHLISSANMTRAEKLMGSIAAGLWVLHPSYLDELLKIGNVNDLKEEHFEWGGANKATERQALTKVVRDCVENAYILRQDIHIYKKPRPFANMKIILNISASKCDSFARLIEAGGGEVVAAQNALGENVIAVCDPSFKQPLNMDDFARRKVRCVTALFINDVIQRHERAIENNYVVGFHDIWKRHNS